jgi:Ca2+:H+ antiporter
LRTHASQIWSNPQKLLHPADASGLSNVPGVRRLSAMQRLLSGYAPTLNPGAQTPGPAMSGQTPDNQQRYQTERNLGRKGSKASQASIRGVHYFDGAAPLTPRPPSLHHRTSHPGPGLSTHAQHAQYQSLYAPVVESVDQVIRNANQGSNVLQLPQAITTEDLARAVTVATVSALRQQTHPALSPAKGQTREAVPGVHHEHDPGGGGDAHGHGGPSWSRFTSASVLLTCTVLYALIAGSVLQALPPV